MKKRCAFGLENECATGLSHDGQRINAKCVPIGVHTKSLMETQ